MHFGLLTQWYDPEPGPAALPGVLARGLVARGHEVTVLTGFPNYPTGRLADGYEVRRRTREERDGVVVERVALYPNHDSSSVRRALNYGSFGLSAVVNGLSALRGLDAMWVNYSPVTVAGAQLMAKLLWRVPSVVHVLDLWPDTLFAGGFATCSRTGRVVRRVLDVWCGAMYRSAASVAYISPTAGDVLHNRGVPKSKLHYVPMWADESVFMPNGPSMRKQLGIANEAIVLMYAGAMGEAQGLDSLIDACRQVTDPRFVCVLAGSGISEGSLRARAADLHNVRFIGRVEQREMTGLMATADMNYVGLRPHALSHLTMPSKTQATLASGKPLIVAAEGDVARVVAGSSTGFVADPGNSDSIRAAITSALQLGSAGLAELGKRSRALYDAEYSVQQGTVRVERLLASAAGLGSTRQAAAMPANNS